MFCDVVDMNIRTSEAFEKLKQLKYVQTLNCKFSISPFCPCGMVLPASLYVCVFSPVFFVKRLQEVGDILCRCAKKNTVTGARKADLWPPSRLAPWQGQVVEVFQNPFF